MGKPLAPVDPLPEQAPSASLSATSERVQTVPVGGRSEERPIENDPDKSQRLVGRILAGRYEVKSVLGRGGMGIVYEAKHITVGRPVAIKILRQDLARSTEAVARFHREAKAAALIGSEHIVEVFDFGYTDDGDAFIAMELLEGVDLGKLIRREGPLPELRALTIAKQVARALEAAHSKGIIHRDLKSENIFLVNREQGEFVKLLDFGISKVSEGDEGRGPMTSEGVVMGTPHYMAPEQAMSTVDADHRIDLYALGCLLYEMLTGRVPFTGKNPVEVVFKHVHEQPVPPSKVRPGLSQTVDALVLKALEKDRDKRFLTASAFLTALGSARTTLVSIEPDSKTKISPPLPTKRMVWLGLFSAFALVGVGVVAMRPARVDPSRVRAQPSTHVPNSLTLDAAALRDGGHVQNPVLIEDTALRINAMPRSAVISVDGNALGSGSVHGLYGLHTRHRIVVQAPGYVPQVRDILLEDSETLAMQLVTVPTGTISARVTRDAGRTSSGINGNNDSADAGQNVENSGGNALDPAEGLKISPYGSNRRVN